ncbi:hypothetical protein [Streptomyces sp. ActVer]|uniref:hypothetical protein n=1 Tax=Streptomyces sp. ActVer TaxID=3014558 RepID=UPI002F96A55C
MSPRPCVESIPAPAFQWIFQRTVSGADDRGRDGSPAKGHTTMLTRLGRLAVRRNRAVLIGVLLTCLGLAAYGAGAQDDLDLARWSSPGTESVRAGDVLREEFGTGNPNLALLVTARDGDVAAPAHGTRPARSPRRWGGCPWSPTSRRTGTPTAPPCAAPTAVARSSSSASKAAPRKHANNSPPSHRG